MIDIEPFGDRGFLARFIDSDMARGWCRAVQEAGFPAVVDVVLAYDVVAIYSDPDLGDLGELERRLSRLRINVSESARDGELLTIPVLYDGDDLSEVASKLELTSDQVIAHHSQPEYRVQAIGFLPGFPYCGDLAVELSGLARRARPRTRVPGGSVAIVG